MSNKETLEILSTIIGWLYFACWSISFYPQVWLNWKRKTVKGLSLDFLLYNVNGYICYSLFNTVLFWSAEVQDEYFARYGPPNPVKLNDIAFALHGLFITCITIAQCFYYDRAGQRNSIYCLIIVSLMWVSMIVLLLVSIFAQKSLSWLWYINYLSYIKLSITFIKYMPQAWMNYKRKSTIGWSIGNILLDFSGGVLSFSQLVLDAVIGENYKIFIGDPVKFGLSVVSIGFDVLFIFQHYLCYRTSNHEDYTRLKNENEKN
eukprot:TRINITY_DN1734_c0_g2_i2.p1 TRINITY_DN1734_c0_g2~~TRINITY_DN1734_c0_g2_i2.p1  ORF type:complete len:261 (+),score=19.89 TRINITY_DN1734_c0_g2_i2:246-1028(+)